MTAEESHQQVVALRLEASRLRKEAKALEKRAQEICQHKWSTCHMGGSEYSSQCDICGLIDD